MSDIALGKKVPKIDLHLTGEKTANLADYRGKPLVLYFYPKANTHPWLYPGGPGLRCRNRQIPSPIVHNPRRLAR